MSLTHYRKSIDEVSCALDMRGGANYLQDFTEVYDGTGGYHRRRSMNRLTVTKVNKGDIVVAECTCQQESSGCGGLWSVGFELLSVVVIARVSE